jgi:Co/Zn/Cd efflux system component
VLAIVLIINVTTFAMMVAGAWLSGSSSLLSGTLDNFGDALTYGLSLAAVGKSARAKAKVALLKGALITIGAIAVALHIAHHLLHSGDIAVAPMGVVAALNLGANAACLWLLTPHRKDDVNMSSVWECSRNDIFEGSAVIGAAGLVWWFESSWPDLVVAVALLALFMRSAQRVLRSAWTELKPVRSVTTP